MSDHNIFQRKLELKKHLESQWKERFNNSEDSPKSAEELIAWVDDKGNRAPVYVGDYYKDPETEIPKESDENDSQAVSLDDNGLNLKTGQVWLDKENKKWVIDTEIGFRDGFIRGRCLERNDIYSFSIITGFSYHRSVQLVSKCDKEPTPQDIILVSEPNVLCVSNNIGTEIVLNLGDIQKEIKRLEHELRWQRKYEDMAIEQILSK